MNDLPTLNARQQKRFDDLVRKQARRLRRDPPAMDPETSRGFKAALGAFLHSYPGYEHGWPKFLTQAATMTNPRDPPYCKPGERVATVLLSEFGAGVLHRLVHGPDPSLVVAASPGAPTLPPAPLALTHPMSKSFFDEQLRPNLEPLFQEHIEEDDEDCWVTALQETLAKYESYDASFNELSRQCKDIHGMLLDPNTPTTPGEEAEGIALAYTWGTITKLHAAARLLPFAEAPDVSYA